MEIESKVSDLESDSIIKVEIIQVFETLPWEEKL